MGRAVFYGLVAWKISLASAASNGFRPVHGYIIDMIFYFILSGNICRKGKKS
jgi:hypothetical protein